MRIAKASLTVRRDSVEELVAGMESNLYWVERRHVEKRQLGGFLGGLQQAGSQLLGDFLGRGGSSSSTTAAAETRPATTAAPPPEQQSTTAPAPPKATTTEQAPAPAPPPPVTTSPPPAPAPEPITTEPVTTEPAATPEVITQPVQSTTPAPVAIPVTTPEAISEKPISTLVPIPEPAVLPTSSSLSDIPALTSAKDSDPAQKSTTAASQSPTEVPDPLTINFTSTLATSTRTSVRPPENTDNSSSNTLTQVSSPEGERGNVTTIVVSVVVIIFGSIAILTAAYFISQRYIRKRRLAEAIANGENPLPSPPLKQMRSLERKFAPRLEKVGMKLGLSKNF